MNPRFIAAQIINDITNGYSLSDCLQTSLSSVTDKRDRALIQAICFGVCRFYIRLDVIVSFLIDKPMKAKDSDVHALILVGLYQLIDMRIPTHAAVAETVNATAKLNKPWARGFVNAILRSYLREKDHLPKRIEADQEAHFAHPEWWITHIKQAWPNHWQAILAANNEHPPFALRVNESHLSRDEYLIRLQQENIIAKPILETKSGVVLESAIPIDKLPGFYQGDVSVQDGAAQIAVSLLELESQQHVLDACAAPGGKLTHILENHNDITCVAVENDAKRMPLIQENLNRLKLHATTICADVSDVKSWWDGKLFDRILLDAPCSASGVVRRHPDIKLLREATDIPRFAQQQRHLLATLWPLLKPNGILVYATCSIFPEENNQVIADFLNKTPNAREEKICLSWGQDQELQALTHLGLQILPCNQGLDGFYYAKLRKLNSE